jgi:hypothetical protein
MSKKKKNPVKTPKPARPQPPEPPENNGPVDPKEGSSEQES